jgi:urease accessory protein
MIVKQKLGNIGCFEIGDRTIDTVLVEWYETTKRIMHKRTAGGMEIMIRFMAEGQVLSEGDILWADDNNLIVVAIEPSDTIVIQPRSMYQMASLCYEIGNKHLPLFYDHDDILVPFDAPLFRLLSVAGYEVSRETRKLFNPLKTTVSPHAMVESKPSLFSKILQWTTPPTDV